MDKINKETSSIINENQKWLQEKFPSCFVEGKLDFDKLKELTSEFTDNRNEKFTFSWAGRADSIKNIQTPTHGTLIPQKDESINFDDTENIFIEGENLEVLKLLQKSYTGKVKMIYIDPPYNTGKDFIYKDDFKSNLESYLSQTGQSKEGVKLTSNPESSGRFHSNWISFMYPRLFLARELLKDDGVIFVSIDDGEINNLRNIMNEIFGEENFVATIIWQKNYSPRNDTKYFSDMHDYIICYAKQKNTDTNEGWKRNLLPRTEEQNLRYTNRDNDKRGVWKAENFTVKTYSAAYDYSITTPSGKIVKPPKGRCWRSSKETFEKLVQENRIWFGEKGEGIPAKKSFLSDVQQGRVPVTLWLRDEVGDNQEASKELKTLFDIPPFDTPKPTRLIRKIIELSTNPNENDIILDFFAGSGTTSNSTLSKNFEDKGNRKFILIQLPEKIDDERIKNDFDTIANVCKERIRRVIKNIQKENKQQKLNSKQNQDLGFKVFKLTKSNYKVWQEVQDEAKLKDQLKLFEDPLIENYKDMDVIYEIIIKEGYSLNSKIEEVSENPNKIYKVSDGEFFFYVTLDEKIDEKALDDLNLDKNIMFVCLDLAINDSQKTNLDKLCKLRTI